MMPAREDMTPMTKGHLITTRVELLLGDAVWARLFVSVLVSRLRFEAP